MLESRNTLHTYVFTAIGLGNVGLRLSSDKHMIPVCDIRLHIFGGFCLKLCSSYIRLVAHVIIISIFNTHNPMHDSCITVVICRYQSYSIWRISAFYKHAKTVWFVIHIIM